MRVMLISMTYEYYSKPALKNQLEKSAVCIFVILRYAIRFRNAFLKFLYVLSGVVSDSVDKRNNVDECCGRTCCVNFVTE